MTGSDGGHDAGARRRLAVSGLRRLPTAELVGWVLRAVEDRLATGSGPTAPTGPAGLAQTILGSRPRYTRAEVASQVDVPLADARRLWRALGFPEVGDDEAVFTDLDVEALARLAGLLDSGLIDLETALGLARAMGQLLARLAGAQLDVLLDTGVARTPAASLLAGSDLLDTVEALTVYAWRRQVAAAAQARLVSHPDASASSRLVGFVDVSGYTRLVQRVAGEELRALLDRFEAVTFDLVAAAGGSLIKTIGDEILYTHPDPAAGVGIALDAVAWADRDGGRIRLHAGLACGPVLERAGDVFGPTVNLAARIAEVARSGTVRVDRTTAELVRDEPGIVVGAPLLRPVRGYPSLRSYRVTRRH